MIFGGQVAEEPAFAILDRALELGIDFLDTADSYPAPPSVETSGRTEEILYEDEKGKWHTETARGSDRPETRIKDKD